MKKHLANAIDVFCGAGGLTRGLERAGIHVIAGLDIDSDCKYPYEHNNRARFILKDIATTTAEDVTKLFPQSGIRVLVGCAPCQPFSKYTQRHNRERDDRWCLLTKFGDLIAGVLPDVISMENVAALTQHEVYDQFICTLKDLKYQVSECKVSCTKYVIAQNRERLVVLASPLRPISLIEPTHTQNHFSTVRYVIGNFEPIAAGGRSKTDRLHH